MSRVRVADTGWPDPDDAVLARSIFGTEHRPRVHRLIAEWAVAQGFGRTRVTTIELSIGAAVTLTQDDGSLLFAKVWPSSVNMRSLAAQMQVQQAMHLRGYPAPAVLTGLGTIGAGWAVGMAYDRSGAPTDARKAEVRRAMATGLGRLVEAADDLRTLDGLPRRTLPPDGAVWPPPHNALFDFAATAQGAEWIDAIARQALAVLRRARGRVVVGHGDWSAKNMRVAADGIAVVYDWDAVSLDCETAILGAAAAHFPLTWELDVPETPSPTEMTAFVRDYETARGRTFTTAERDEIAAGATYARAYKARCEHAIGAPWAGSSGEALKALGPIRF